MLYIVELDAPFSSVSGTTAMVFFCFRYDGDGCEAAQEEGRSQWHHPLLGPSLTFMVVMDGASV